jgi:dTMP kinase
MNREPLERARTSSGVPRGFFLTFEGIEGSGKTTHARRLEEAVGKAGYRVSLTREPGGTPLAETLRSLALGTEGESPEPETELLIIVAARAQHLRRFILPRLNRGEVVICDRFSDASLAYQGGGRGLGLARVATVNEMATGGIQPDFTVLCDVPVEEALDRVRRRGKGGGDYNRFDREDREFHEAVQATYLELARRERERFFVVSAVRSKEDVGSVILSTVLPLLQVRRDEGGLV